MDMDSLSKITTSFEKSLWNRQTQYERKHFIDTLNNFIKSLIEGNKRRDHHGCDNHVFNGGLPRLIAY
jgi:hypothetical protein